MRAKKLPAGSGRLRDEPAPISRGVLANAVSRSRPWEAAGVSRATWYRQRQPAETSAPNETCPQTRACETSPRDLEHETGVREPVETSAGLIEARASVEALYAKMDAERARRWRWWAQPVDDAPDRITIRSILTGDTVTIRLDGAAARRKRKSEAPAARFWWEDPT